MAGCRGVSQTWRSVQGARVRQVGYSGGSACRRFLFAVLDATAVRHRRSGSLDIGSRHRLRTPGPLDWLVTGIHPCLSGKGLDRRKEDAVAKIGGY
jgi:hypothetical protein